MYPVIVIHEILHVFTCPVYQCIEKVHFNGKLIWSNGALFIIVTLLLISIIR